MHNRFREGYFNGAISIHHGRHVFKAGIESDDTFLQENFSGAITDPSQFDPATPLTFAFPGNQPSAGNRPDLEQAG